MNRTRRKRKPVCGECEIIVEQIVAPLRFWNSRNPHAAGNMERSETSDVASTGATRARRGDSHGEGNKTNPRRSAARGKLLARNRSGCQYWCYRDRRTEGFGCEPAARSQATTG